MFRQTSNHCKRFLDTAKLPCATKIAISFLKKGKSAMPPVFNRLEVLSSASGKAKLFAKNF